MPAKEGWSFLKKELFVMTKFPGIDQMMKIPWRGENFVFYWHVAIL